MTGGTKKGDTGYFFQPTVFTDVKPEMKIVREEIFGPVAVVIKFKIEEEVIEMANNTDYGLNCMVFTENISRALRVAHALEAGQACVSALPLLFRYLAGVSDTQIATFCRLTASTPEMLGSLLAAGSNLGLGRRWDNTRSKCRLF